MTAEAAVHGSVRPGWEAVREAFAHAQADDPGAAQLAVRHAGRPVVDLWTRSTAATAGRPFGPDSVTVLMSVSKAMTATCAHLLAQRGRLDLGAPVARYWPEFRAAGKAHTTVADLLAHRAGLPAFTDDPAGTGLPGLLDWNARVRGLAAMRPLWEPGTAYLYHTLTQGHLVGEVVRRVAGASIGTYFAREVAGPLGLDLWMGLPRSAERRFVRQAPLRPAPGAEQVDAAIGRLGLTPDDRTARFLSASARELAVAVAAFDTRRGRAAEIPAAGGIGDARSLARLYAALIGEVDGVRLLSAATVDRARTPRTDHLPPPGPLHRFDGPDRSRFGLGFELPRPGEPLLGEGSFGHAGAGGRLGMAHPENRLAVGYVCTAMSWEPSAGPDPRWLPWTEAVREASAAAGRA
ncbi:serine hydrolase domain-containing protein [Streptomyces sp. NPDC057336]|uniref:serine hydrolase domain-containing protein n=1 Tax=Streptomyces sp. NPDC057336 TaxID=3346102 RepID=UPI003640ECD5